MTGGQLVKLATAAFGKRWKYSLAAELDMSREQFWRYEKGHTPISEEMDERLRKVLRRQLEKQAGHIQMLLKSI